MNLLTPDQKIQLFLSLFKGRPEVFARRWESRDDARSGYSPVCLTEWKQGVCTKAQGKKCQNCTYAALNSDYIKKHLQGEMVLGIYPMLLNNTSYVFVADFDQTTWLQDAKKFLEQCQKYNLPAYVERSRSGNGAHVWLFFAEAYSAVSSRLIGFHLLKAAGVVDQFAPLDSFDRFIPNQDMLRRGAIGNLIALPLQKQARQENNSVFLDPQNNYEPYIEQWDCLQNIQKISTEQLNSVLFQLQNHTPTTDLSKQKKLSIIVNNHIVLSRSQITPALQIFLTEKLNFLNSQYLALKQMNRNTYGIERYFRLIEQHDDLIFLPRGFLQPLTQFCEEQQINYIIHNQRHACETIKFQSSYQLRPEQVLAVEELIQHTEGILVAPPGTGKTIIGLELIARIQQPALIMVHTKQIMEQWVQRIQDMLGIHKADIGQIAGNKKKWGEQITVAMVQSLHRYSSLAEYRDKFGVVIVDECHHMPAQMFRAVVTQFNPYYLYGLTATPDRKFNDKQLISLFLGEILYTIDPQTLQQSNNSITSTIDLKICSTTIELPFSVRTDILQLVYKTLIFDTQRNQQIINDVESTVNSKLRCLIITERKDQAELLHCYLSKQHEVIVLTGELSKGRRELLMKQIQAADFEIVIATGQLVGEGTDIAHFDVLFLVYPFSSPIKLKQYIGRLQRGAQQPCIVYDYRDQRIGFFEQMFKKRKTIYKKHFGVDVDNAN